VNDAPRQPDGPDAPVQQPTPSGLLLIDKEKSFTSMDVCAIVRGKLRRAGAPKRIKVGHAGTLDPMATGLLVVLVGKATRLCNQFMADQKVYEATVDLSHRSTTDDAEGQLTPVPIASPPTLEQVRQAAAAFVGTIQQRPPDFSAMSIGGKRAYDLAREGKPVRLAARPVRIDEITIRSYGWPLLEITVSCGKGTYIRSLARDVGTALNAGGMLTALRRTRSGAFAIDHARTVSSLPDPLGQSDLLPIPEEPS
jgi:tRNA pseudouridine55 synthase